MKIQSYLSEVTEQVRFAEAHPTIKNELESHILDTVDGLISLGNTEEQAIHEAINRMGSAGETGKKLDLIHRPYWDFGLLGGLTLLLIVGMVSMSHGLHGQAPICLDLYRRRSIGGCDVSQTPLC